MARLLLICALSLALLSFAAADLPEGLQLTGPVDTADFLANQPNKCSKHKTANKGFFVRKGGGGTGNMGSNENSRQTTYGRRGNTDQTRSAIQFVPVEAGEDGVAIAQCEIGTG